MPNQPAVTPPKLDPATLRAVDAALAADGYTESRAPRQIIRALLPTAFQPRRVPVVRAVAGRFIRHACRIEFRDGGDTVVLLRADGTNLRDTSRPNAALETNRAYADAFCTALRSALDAADGDGMEPDPNDPNGPGGGHG